MEFIQRKEQGEKVDTPEFFIFDPNPGLAARAKLRDENLGISGVRPVSARLKAKKSIRKN